jgi:hypothetical protein
MGSEPTSSQTSSFSASLRNDPRASSDASEPDFAKTDPGERSISDVISGVAISWAPSRAAREIRSLAVATLSDTEIPERI